MNRPRTAIVVTLVAAAMVGSVVALPVLQGGLEPLAPDEAAVDATAKSASDAASQAALQEDADRESTEFDPIELEPPGTDGAATTAGGEQDDQAAVQADHDDAVEAGVSDGIALVQSQGVEVTQEQRAAAIDGAREAASQYQTAEAEQVQAATAGAVHGALIQKQSVNATQIQSTVGGATGGGLSQSQSVNATQLQSATWGAAHGTIAQSQNVTVEQLQFASNGAAAGAASEAGAKDVGAVPKIQEAAQGSAYGVLTQYQSISVEQRQQVTLEHVQHAAAGAAAGSLEGSTPAALEQEQRVDVRQEQRTETGQEQRVEAEQRQRVTIKQIQKSAAGAAKGALVQQQAVSVEQTQAAARGASRGSLKQIQSVSVAQFQRISITQVQEAAFGAATGSITQSQEATVEQIQAAADGAAGGVLVQRQSVSVTQTQSAATGAASGAVTAAIQRQEISIEQVQAAAFGAGEGAVTQTQVVHVTQVQRLAQGAASGALVQSQEATVTQVQIAAQSACTGTARAVQSQRISVTQLQTLTAEIAADATAYAIREDTTDVTVISQHVEVEVDQRIEAIDPIEGTASIDLTEQESDGERVTIEDVSLSEGGFVAVYEGAAVDADPDEVRGVSSYLEAGDHENVTIELDEPLAESSIIVAIAHHDTNDDETFQYADSGGEVDVPYVGQGGIPVFASAFVTIADEPDEPEATLSVDDQTGDGETLTVDEANASVPYALTAEYDGETVESETFAAGEAVTNRSIDLDPPLEENATVDVSVVSEDGEALANESIEYTITDDAVPDEPVDEPNATLSVSDQTGDGSTLTVDEANATVEYALTVTDEDGAPIAESDAFPANEAVTNETVALEPPLEGNATVDVAVVATADDERLVNETIEYAVTDEPTEPEATLSVDDQTGDGDTLEIDATRASVPYIVTAEYDGERVDSDRFEANETVAEQSLELEPPLEENATVDVSVRAAADDAVLANESIEYAVVEPDPAQPTANLSVADQAGDGETLTVTAANASVDYAITVTDEDGTRIAESDAFSANQTIGPTALELEPPLEENATLEVAVVATEDGAVLETNTVAYTVDGEVENFDVAFTSCSRAVVDASLEAGDEVAASTGFYDRAGFGNTIIEDYVTVGEDVEAPFDGTIVFEIGDERDVTVDGDNVTVQIPEYGTFGTYISGISSPEAVPFAAIDYGNPSAETCNEEARPDLPSLSVVETTPTDDGINVTFGYENPNDATVSGNSRFVEGTTADEPPSELEPGEGTVTVEWTPESDDERLVWEIDFANYGYDDPVTAATPTAGEIEPSDPASFGVSITGTNSPVEQGDQLAVEADVRNTGGEAGTQNVTLAVDGTTVDAESVSLEPGESRTASFAVDTDGLDPGEYPLAVSTANETAETTVIVEASGEPATFDVSITGTNSPVERGDPLAVEAELENVGDEAGTQDVGIAVDGVPGEPVSVSLEPGETQTVTLNYETADLDPGEYPLAVSTANETAETTVTVEASGEPAEFSVTDVSAPASGEPSEEVAVTAIVENEGDREGTQTVTYGVDDQPVAQSTVTLAGGQSAEIQFSSVLPEGTSTHTITTDDDQASVTIEAAAPESAGSNGDAGPETGDDQGPPDETGPPDEPGPPEEPGPPDESGPPEGQGSPDETGPPEGQGPPDESASEPTETPNGSATG
ncbi:DUF7282 domain-containing protein [Natrinema salaciae]|uniref:CARDB protein n=1 Tax=Natrinema salaciae TaxID=1186196 RepID=A0A1H9S6N4_9EURY|nr:CARDB domain-containing protein [Natrinema salaciae]SER80706.1 CARDB protein [Natrinema salaciae]